MSSLAISVITFACAVGGVLLGMMLRRLLPEHHLRDDSKDVMRLGSGLIATLVALVLGLLVSSAKSSFDAISDGLTQAGAKVIVLHRVLVRYGPETKDARDLLRRSIAATIQRVWPADKTKGVDTAAVVTATGVEDISDKIRDLAPRNDAQRLLQSQALQISSDLLQSRWLLIEQAQTSLPMVFLVIVVFWLTVLNVSFGLFAPWNATAATALVVCALSVSGAIFLILEMNRPFAGVIEVSSAPLQTALEVLSR